MSSVGESSGDRPGSAGSIASEDTLAAATTPVIPASVTESFNMFDDGMIERDDGLDDEADDDDLNDFDRSLCEISWKVPRRLLKSSGRAAQPK